jgi:hypothetical protein
VSVFEKRFSKILRSEVSIRRGQKTMAIFTRHRAIGRRSTLRLRVAAGVPALAGALLSILAPGHAHAQTTYIKQNTTTLLNGADWSPTWAVTDTTGIMTFNNTLSASNAANLS